MNQWLKITFLLSMMAAFWCFAENFIVEEKPAPRRTIAQLRQEVMELMGDVIEQEAHLVQAHARLQGTLCSSLRAYARGDKKSAFARVSNADLLKMAKLLRHEKERQIKEKNFVEQLSKDMRTFLTS